MIIKFVCEGRPDITGEPSVHGSLRMFETDEISFISRDPITSVDEFGRLYDAIKLGDYQLFAGTPETINTDQHGRMNAFKVMQFMDGKGKERTVLFDNVAYVCNGEGKTVEKIYAY